MAEPLTIQAQGTPNPNAAKFTLNRIVAAQGTTYRLPAAPESNMPGAAQAGDAIATPSWAKGLLIIPGVAQIFAVNNFISVTKRPEADWNQIGPQIEAVLQQAFA